LISARREVAEKDRARTALGLEELRANARRVRKRKAAEDILCMCLEERG
jgi:hypothetical protein